MTSCCDAAMACSNDAACLCALKCSNVGCIDSCEAMTLTGTQSYSDFAGCLQMNCSPQCPNLTPAMADL
jgi:hypothetical protein